MKATIKDRIVAHRSAPDVYDPPSFEQMADRIEELEAELSESEALLAKAMKALVRIADTPSEMTWGVDSEVREAMNEMETIAETTLAELTGGKDD